MKKLKTLVLIIFGGVYLFSFSSIYAEIPESEEAKQVVSLVNSTVKILEIAGRDAFPMFRKKGGKWYMAKTYVFINDMNGTALVNPPSPEIEGKSLIDMQDIKGKFIMKEFIEKAKTDGSGWVEYWWPKPEEIKPSKKISFIKKATMPSGEIVFVGSGIYIE